MRLCLAAAETAWEHAAALYQARAPSVLTSFYYADGIEKTTRLRLWEACLKVATFRLADSGAHTFREDTLHGSTTSNGVDVDRFLLRYIAWLLEYQSLLDAWVELDIGIAAGRAWVDGARQRMLDAGLGRGLIRAWHMDEHGWEDWLEMVEEARAPGRSRFVAIEGRKAGTKIDYKRFLRVAYDAGVRVHGFRMTDVDRDLTQLPFWSVDSTSWIAGATYDCHTYVGVHGWPHAVKTKGRAANRSRHQTWRGGNLRGSGMPTRLANLVAAARAWGDAEVSLTNLWKSRGVDWDARLKEAV